MVGDGNYDLVARSPLSQPVHPRPESSAVVLDAQQDGSGAVDQHATPINVAKSRPRRKAAPWPMAATVAVETSGPKPGI